MQNGGRFAIRLGVFATVLLCGALAVPAFAFVTTASNHVGLPPLARGSVSASCEPGDHAVFGGMAAAVDSASYPLESMYITDMHLSTVAKWAVNGQNSSTSHYRRLTAIVYCAPGARDFPHTVSATKMIASNTWGSATATCPAHLVVIGGGFHTPARLATGPGATPPRGIVTALHRVSSSAWRASIRNVSEVAVPVTAIAYCGAGPSAELSKAATYIEAFGGAGNVTASCRPGTHVVFGGFAASDYPGVDPPAVIPFGFSAPSTTAWRVDARNLGAWGGSLTSLAYCR